MKPWVIPTTMFCIGLGLGLSGPILASRYMEPYMPGFLKNSLHPLEGIVTNKQRDQDRLLVTVTTQDGTILTTFRKHVAEIDLLIEEHDSITLELRQYEPFVNDPPVLKVNKQVPQVQAPGPVIAPPPPSSMELGQPLDSLPSPGESSGKSESHPPSLD
ncbi:MAG: hypothetical protein OEY80_03010 [Nitrospirota bacterium]|nr:hypothetical protein [Nitrospirota bacterium]MDH5574432.1 hypothetical protein [Nitrospirota bacterium]